MKDKLNNLLDSYLTPIVCLVVAVVVNQFTYDMSNVTVFRLIEVVLFATALIVTLRMYTSWIRYLLLVLCVVGVLSSGINLLPSRSGNDQPGQSSGSGNKFDRGTQTQNSGSNYVNRIDPTWQDSELIEQKCYHCSGSGKCSECDGTGKISIEKQGINLGGGSSTYHQYQRCPLCDGERKCIWCNGKGYITY